MTSPVLRRDSIQLWSLGRRVNIRGGGKLCGHGLSRRLRLVRALAPAAKQAGPVFSVLGLHLQKLRRALQRAAGHVMKTIGLLGAKRKQLVEEGSSADSNSSGLLRLSHCRTFKGCVRLAMNLFTCATDSR